jgi:hypothetical protein
MTEPLPRLVEDEGGFAHLWRNAQRRRGTYFGLWMRQLKAKEAFMRVITVAVVMIAVLAIGGFTLRHMPSATAEQAKAQIDPHALQLTIDIKSLPDQKLPGDLFGGPPYP